MSNILTPADMALIDCCYEQAVEMYNAQEAAALGSPFPGDEHSNSKVIPAILFGHRGCAYLRMNMLERAQTDFMRAHELEPENDRWKYYIFYCERLLHNKTYTNTQLCEINSNSSYPWLSSLIKSNFVSSGSLNSHSIDAPPPSSSQIPSNEEPIEVDGNSIDPLLPHRSQFSSNKESMKIFDYDWYQTHDEVVVCVYVQNVQSFKPDIEVDQSNKSCALHCLFQLESNPGDSKVFKIDLAHTVSNEVQYKISKKKVEIICKKFVAGYQWTTLEKSISNQNNSFNPSASGRNQSSLECSHASLKQTTEQWKPCDFKSGKTKKSWDQIANELDEASGKDDPSVEDFFRQIYAGSSDEVRKAMMKSYQESGGTVLSTNWDDVSQRHVDMQPPDGMEFKKWS